MIQRIVIVVLAAVLAALLWHWALPSRVPIAAEWGDAAAHAAAARIARAAYAGEAVAPEDVAALPAEPPRWVFVTAHGPAGMARTEARGTSTAESLATAARELGEWVQRAVTAGHPAPEWLVVDVVGGRHRFLTEPDGNALEEQYETGVDGLLAEADGALGAVLPGDPITEGWFSPRRADPKGGRTRWYTRGDEGLTAKKVALTRLTQALGGRPEDEVRWSRFRTDSFLLELDRADAPPVSLFRGMPVGPLVPTPDAIHASAIAGGNWLVSMVGEDGMFKYTYVPNRDQDPPPGSYSYIRHTATAWMMVRLGRRFDQPEWVDAAVRALEWSEQQIVPAPAANAGRAERGRSRRVVAAPREAKGGLGHNAVTIIALAEIKDRLTPEQVQKVKDVGVSLEMMLRCESETPEDACVGGDGGFYESESENLGRPKDKTDRLAYEPGEGFLALVTLAEWFPEEKHWLDSAIVSARYQAGKFLGCGGGWFDRKVFLDCRLRFADRVHWQTMAFEKLGNLTGDPTWHEVSVEMGKAVLATGTPGGVDVSVKIDGRPLGAHPWDYSGSYPLWGRLPRTTPTGSRAEALNSARRSALKIGKDPTPFESMLLRTAGFQLRNQFTETSCYFCPKPEKALGAFRAGLTDNEIRIDFIQHVIAGQADTLEWYQEPTVAAN